MEQRYDENFGNVFNLDKISESLDEFKEDCLRRSEFTMKDTQIKKVRRCCVKEQYRNKKIAALTSKHQLTENQEMYALIFEKMMEYKLIRKFDSRLLALELVSPVSLMLGIADREPHRTNEMLTQIDAHLTHFIKIYGIEKE